MAAIRWLDKKNFHLLVLELLIKGSRYIVIGNNLALVNKTARKMFIRFPPDSKVSAITNWPGKAKAKKEDKKL